MNIEPLIELIKRFEGCKLMPYYCPAGVLTAGWGSTGAGVLPGVPWTQEEADARLLLDALKAIRQTQALCPNITNDNRLCAIADFVYNLGSGRLRSSTMRQRILSEDWDRVPDELRKWVNGGGKRLPGLIKRREAEIALVLSA